jgi:hypothetical protein
VKRKQPAPLWTVPAPTSLDTPEAIEAWIARQDPRPLRQILDGFLAHVLDAKASGDRGSLLEQAQRHARYVRTRLGRADEREVALIAESIWLGEAWQRFYIDAKARDRVRAGEGTVRGGKKAADAKHGTADEREARREAWRARFAVLRSEFPTDDKGRLLDILEEETGTPVRTLRRYIPQK